MRTSAFYILVTVCVFFKTTDCKKPSATGEEILSIQAKQSPHVETSSASYRVETSLPSKKALNISQTGILQKAKGSSTISEVTSGAKNMTETEFIQEKWKSFQKTMKTTISGEIKKALPVFLRIGSDAKLSSECLQGMVALMRGIRGLKSWAFRMLDASGKLPSGIIDGTLTDFGDYDECLAIEKFSSEKTVEFTGHYCVINLKPLLPRIQPNRRIQLNNPVVDFSNISEPDSFIADMARHINIFYAYSARIGLCVPSICSVNDVQEMANQTLKDMPIVITVERCEKKEPYKISNLQIASMSVITFFLLLIAMGTFFDVKTSSSFESRNKIYSGIIADSLKCFSIEKNLKKLLKTNQSKENLGVLNGLRVLSLVWVILFHNYILINKQSISRMRNVQDYWDDVTFQTILNGWVTVDTFFVVGAFLVVYSNLKTLTKDNGRLNFVRYYLHRIWRLMPPVVGALLVMYLLPLVGSGPMFKETIGKEVGNCEKNWWKILLIPFNSWQKPDDICFIHSWYIAVDMQLYFLAPIILVPLYKWPIIGFMIMLFLNLICMTIVAALTLIHDFYPTMLVVNPNHAFLQLQVEKRYFRPYTHLGSYSVGLVLGYLVLHYKKTDIKTLYQVLGWCAAIACNLAVLYGSYEWNRDNVPNKIVDVSYAVLHRTGWSLGIAWLIYMCITDRGGIINRFLSWNIFLPLCRLTYNAYIIHLPILWLRNGYRRELLTYQHVDIIYEFLGNVMLTFLLSVIFYLMFEAPFLNLEEVWFPKRCKSQVKTKDLDSEMNGVTTKI